MIKKIIVLFLFFVLCIGNFNKKFLYTEKDIGYNFFISFSFFSLEEENLENISLNTYLLKNIFFETIYNILVKEELISFKPILNELEKPFVNFWIVKAFFYLLFNKIVCIFLELKRHFKIPVVIKIITLLFTFLFYFKLHLKTNKVTPLVLRC
ncbi:MAG: hypothetical protein ABIL76_02780 [candidate division WOR-3 bacterium]